MISIQRKGIVQNSMLINSVFHKVIIDSYYKKTIMYKLSLIIFLTICCLSSSSAQSTINSSNNEIHNSFSYAYIRVEGKFLSKKLKVKVDLGDSDEQIAEGEKLSEILTNKKSYAAILNYMSKIGFELVNTFDLTRSSDGSGGTSGIIYVMKKAEE